MNIIDETRRRQEVADERDQDPLLDGAWSGFTTQPDMDSHQFWLTESCDEGCPCEDCRWARADAEDDACPCADCNV